jgi:hypothetical protein
MNKYFYSSGSSKMVINNRVVDSKNYELDYDGNKLNYVKIDNNDGKYVKLNNNDIKKIMNKPSNNRNSLEKELKLLLKGFINKRKTKRRKKKTKRNKKKKTTRNRKKKK